MVLLDDEGEGIEAVPLTATKSVSSSQPAQAAPTRLSSLKSAFSWTLLGNVIYAGCQWGMLMALAKLGSAHAVGQFSYALAIVTPLFLLSNLQLQSVLVTDAQRQFGFGTYWNLRLLTSSLALGSVVVLAFFAPTGSAVGLVLVGLWKAHEALGDLLGGALQRRDRMEEAAQSSILKGVLSLGALVALYGTTGSLVWAVAGLTLASVISVVFFDLPRARRCEDPTPWRAEPGQLWRILRVSAPLGVVVMLMSLNTSIPRIFIEQHVGAHSLGIYSALSYIVVAGGVVVGALGQAASPSLANTHAAGDRTAFVRLLLIMMVTGAGLGLAGIGLVWLVGGTVLEILYTAEYAVHLKLFLIIMVGAAVSFVASMMAFALTAMRIFKVQVWLAAAMTATSAAAGALLIPRLGLEGAAWAAAVTAVVQLVGLGGVLLIALRREVA